MTHISLLSWGPSHISQPPPPILRPATTSKGHGFSHAKTIRPKAAPLCPERSQTGLSEAAGETTKLPSSAPPKRPQENPTLKPAPPLTIPHLHPKKAPFHRNPISTLQNTVNLAARTVQNTCPFRVNHRQNRRFTDDFPASPETGSPSKTPPATPASSGSPAHAAAAAPTPAESPQ